MSDLKVPPFATLQNDTTLIFDQDGELHYYIPETYFGSNLASIEAPYTKLLGSFPYRIYTKTGKPGKLKIFKWPTIFLCIPTSIKKEKNLVLDEGYAPADYRVLIFQKGSQLVSDINTPQFIDNAKDLLTLHIITSKFPNIIPYNQLYEYPYLSMELNGENLGVHSQLVSMMYAKACRDPENIRNEYRLSKSFKNGTMIGYTPISVKEVPKYVSPYASLTSENMDESVIAAVILSEDIKEGKAKYNESPLENILTM